MVKFTKRFEKIAGVIKAVYVPIKLHLTIFYDVFFEEEEIRRKVLIELRESNLENSVETFSFYPEEVKQRD